MFHKLPTRPFALCITVILLFVLGTTMLTARPVSADGPATWQVDSNCAETTSSLTTVPTIDSGVGTCSATKGVPISSFAYFDVSSSYMNGSSPYTYAKVDIEYYDGPYISDGSTNFVIEYDSTSSPYASSAQRYYLNNTEQFLTASFYLANIKFSGDQNGGADFRVSLANSDSNSKLYIRNITVTGSTSNPAPSYASASSVSFQAPGATSNVQGLYLKPVGDGHPSLTTSLGRSAFQVSSSNYAYFNVDDTYLYQGGSGYTYAGIQVSYYDGGTGRFFVEYDASSGAPGYNSSGFTSSESAGQTIFLTGSNSWVTATLYLSNVYFGNRQNDFADVRLNYQPASGESYRLNFDRVTVTRSTTSLIPSFALASSVSFVSPATENGLYRATASGSDGRIAGNTDYGRVGSQVSSAGYASFNVDDTYLKDGSAGGTSYPYASVEVSYYDKGTGFFLIEYDKTGSDGAYSAIPVGDRVFLTDSSTWITTTFYLDSVYFGNREGYSSDLRINYQPQGNSYRLVFDRVTVRRSATDLTPNYATASVVSFQSPSLASGLRLRNVGDGLTTPVVITDSLGAARTGNRVSSAGYAYFDANDSFIYDSSYKYAAVDVSYYDQGYGRFYLVYDSNSSLAADASATQSFDNVVQSNNVAYLANSRTWKTYRFYLSNLKFADRQLVGLADFKIVYAMDSSATTANQGYLLTFDRVTVTRYNSAPDRADTLSGNATGSGNPVVVWTRLAQVNDEGHGLWQNEGVSDGSTTSSTQGSEQSRQNSPGGFIYFDVNDKYVYQGNAYNVYVTVEYFDNGTNSFTIQYDSTGNANKESEAVARTNTDTWKKYTFYLTDAYFGNRQNGGDFRIAAPAKDLYAKGVYVERAPGDSVLPRSQSFSGSSFTTSDRIVVTHYFPVFDGYRPTLWERSTMGPPGADGTTHIATNYSFRDVATIKKDLEEMKDANIDGLLIWYSGNTQDTINMAGTMMRNLVTAAGQVTNPPKIGLLLDAVHPYAEQVMKERDDKVNLTSTAGKAYFFKLAEDFYSQLPSDLWLRVNGRPVIAVYYQGSDFVTSYDSSVIDNLKERFATSFGVQPYLICDKLWDPQGDKGISTDEWFSWGASYTTTPNYPGFANQNTMEVGPGFNDGARTTDRQSGDFYARSWQRAIGKGNHLVLVDTWNYWVEGTAIAESAEYGRTYIDATATYAATFKGARYSNSNTATVTLGSTNSSSGVYQDEISDAPTTAVSMGGLTGRKATGPYMYFSLDDSFILHRAAQFTINIKYWDAVAAAGGVDWFVVQYDGVGGYQNYPPQTDANTVHITLSNTQTWKTTSFTFSDGYFANRLPGSNDFRLAMSATGGLIVNQISVQAAQIPNLPNKVYVPLMTKNSSGAW